ncbi:hypothetical protein L914_05699 [Phytophthora nicotianae]|uniref:Uncharacterized protein n=1 Tax=Phytophthora nicotianae TaxID=4792 RepID=W2NRC0_PHYNI|nr:hypothetical protein L914_05699 [Phytophthora nicotianae]
MSTQIRRESGHTIREIAYPIKRSKDTVSRVIREGIRATKGKGPKKTKPRGRPPRAIAP